MNGIGEMFDRTSWRPQFFMCATSYVKEEAYRNNVLRAVEECDIANIL